MTSKALPDFVVVRFVFAGLFVVLLGFTGRARNFSFAICARRRWLEGEPDVGLERRPIEHGANCQIASVLRVVLAVRLGIAEPSCGRRGGQPSDESVVEIFLGWRRGARRGHFTVVAHRFKLRRTRRRVHRIE